MAQRSQPYSQCRRSCYLLPMEVSYLTEDLSLFQDVSTQEILLSYVQDYFSRMGIPLLEVSILPEQGCISIRFEMDLFLSLGTFCARLKGVLSREIRKRLNLDVIWKPSYLVTGVNQDYDSVKRSYFEANERHWERHWYS